MRLPGNPATLVVALVTLVGAAIRIAVAGDALFADELSTYWIVTAHGPRGVLSTVHSNAEITPPLYFVLAWLTAQLGHAPELVRAPSLVAGIASIPLAYLLGLRTVGRRAALVAAAVVAFSPFMIYYSAEARAYGLLMALVMLSTLTMLLAVDTGRTGWWAGYAVSSCLAVYTHYTCVFALAAQLAWLLWTAPEARKPAIVANLAALAGFLPWTTGLINDLSSPTAKILSALSPLTLFDIRQVLEHWSIGYPYSWVAKLDQLPGTPALVLLALALAMACWGLVRAARRLRPRGRLPRLDRRVVLVGLLFVSVPLGEGIASAVGDNIFGVRNLAASWPGLALLLGAILTAAGPRLGLIAGGLAVASFGLGAGKLLTDQYQRPDYRAAARYIDREAGSGDAIIDITGVLSPGPLSGLDAALRKPHRIFRAGAPEERRSPFGIEDRPVTLAAALPKAIAAAPRGRIYVVATVFPQQIPGLEERTRRVKSPYPDGYREIASHLYPGIAGTAVVVYADGDAAR
jgi:mannosyltransferase